MTNRVMPTYAKPKEKVFEAYSPFAELKNKKMYSPTLANIAMFGTTKVVEKATELFVEQVGIDHGSEEDLSSNNLTMEARDSSAGADISNS